MVGIQYDVFLSHSSKDRATVREVAERLQRDGLKVWFDEWRIRPGDSILAKIDEGLEHSRILVLFMSRNAFGSEWSRLESYTYRFKDPLNQDRRFVPLRMDDAPIKGSLAQFHYIDWREQSSSQAYLKLLEACRNPETRNSFARETQPAEGHESSACASEEGRKPLFTKCECEILTSVPDHGWIYLVQTDVYGRYVSTGKGEFFDPADASVQAKYLDAFELLFAKGILRSEGSDAYRLTGRGFEFRNSFRSHTVQKDKAGLSASTPTTEKHAGKNDDYCQLRRETIKAVFAEFEVIHAFFFEVCVDYVTTTEILHRRLAVMDEVRNKYYRYIRTIGMHLQKIHLLEGRLALAGADGSVKAMQRYRLQATEVNDMLRLQLPCKTKSEVESVANELFGRKDRFYEELANALKA